MRQAFTEQQLVDTFKLDQRDMERIMINEGRIHLSLKDGCVYLELPSIDATVIYPPHLHEVLVAKLDARAYRLSLEDTLIKVHSTTHYPSSFLLTDFARQALERYVDLSDDIVFMTSTRPQVPLFIGQYKVIERLADDFDSLDGIMGVNEFLTWKERYVRSE